MLDKNTHPYVAWHKDDYNAAVLVFAGSAAKARSALRQAFCLTKGWLLMDIRVRRIHQNTEYFSSLHTGHAIIENPPQCAVCGTWETPLSDNKQGAKCCASCRDG